MEKKLLSEINRQLEIMKLDNSEKLYDKFIWEKIEISNHKNKFLKEHHDYSQKINEQFAPWGQTQSSDLVYPKSYDKSPVCDSVYNKIVEEVEGGYMPWRWGTDESGLVSNIKRINDENTYNCVFNKLASKYPEIKLHQGILPWLQSEEFSEGGQANVYRGIGGEEGNDLYQLKKDSPVGLGISYADWANDKYLYQMEKHLLKFSPFEKFTFEKPEPWDTELMDKRISQGRIFDPEVLKIFRFIIPPAAREAIHNVALVSSLILSFGNSWPAVIASFSIEMADAAFYKWIDRDDYGAGLAAIFACAGPLDQSLGPFVKKYGLTVLKKLQLGKKLSKTERLILEYTGRNVDKLIKLAKIGSLQRLIRVSLQAIKVTAKFVKAIFIICKKIGGKVLNFLSKPALMISGSFITWDMIASAFDICNSMPLSKLSDADNAFLKSLGTVGPILQPFTNPCEQEKLKNAVEQVRNKLKKTNEKIILILDELIQNKVVFSESKYSKTYLSDVAYIQFILKYFKIQKSYNKKRDYEKYGTKTITRSDGTKIKVASHSPQLMQYKPDYKGDLYSNLQQEPNFKWGHYDSAVSNLIKTFQEDYNLSVDGVAGPEVFKKMKSLMKSLGSKQIPEYVSVPMSENAKKSQLKELEKNLKKQKEDNKKIPPTKIIEDTEKDKKEIENKLLKELENLDDYDEAKFERIMYELSDELRNLA